MHFCSVESKKSLSTEWLSRNFRLLIKRYPVWIWDAIRLIFLWRCGPTRAIASSFLMFIDHTLWRTTVSRTPLDKWSTHRRYIYLKTYNTHKRQTYIPPAGFEGKIPVKKATESPHPRPRHHWGRHTPDIYTWYIHSIINTYGLFKESVGNLGYNLEWLNDCWI
jgi:hypothetical protein